MPISKILAAAQARAKEKNHPYEGALTPAEAYEILKTAPGAKLVDVRTHAEWDWVGTIPGATQIEWLTYPYNHVNPHFLDELKQSVNPESLVLFICRSGARSHAAAAAATKAGFRDSYNVLEGFEGDKDTEGHRNKKAGWRAAGLPWVQS
ncbi:MAG: rhodanese-like domain-containing protein [Burkholderiales bacterium]